jgi:hypothetical protein
MKKLTIVINNISERDSKHIAKLLNGLKNIIGAEPISEIPEVIEFDFAATTKRRETGEMMSDLLSSSLTLWQVGKTEDKLNGRG